VRRQLRAVNTTREFSERIHKVSARLQNSRSNRNCVASDLLIAHLEEHREVGGDGLAGGGLPIAKVITLGPGRFDSDTVARLRRNGFVALAGDVRVALRAKLSRRPLEIALPANGVEFVGGTRTARYRR
jgi:hypothetical protein